MRKVRYSAVLIFIAGEALVGILLYLAVKNYSETHYEKLPVRVNEINHSKETKFQGISLYKYYNVNEKGGNTPLLVGKETFLLNGKNLTVLSGAIHYFRVHPIYWQDRLRKLRAMGANTVETYIPWNLHEPEKDHYDFGKNVSGTDYPFSEWLDVVKFIKLAKEEDLFVIIRPGPYICSEWDFGGLPSYLLNPSDIEIRTNDPSYIERVNKYFDQLLPRLSTLQIEHGGPILIFQIENEYGHFVEAVGNKNHLKFLKSKMQEFNITGPFVTSDGILLCGSSGTLIEDDVLATANFQDREVDELNALKAMQPFKAAMVMEFWTGWFNHWGNKHSVRDPKLYASRLHNILEYPASVNLYMFHGGTNFGFMNGANQWEYFKIDYEPDTTSYDYDAVLSENGNYTEKYFLTRELFMKKLWLLGITVPDPPQLIETVAYQTIDVVATLKWNNLVENVYPADRVTSTLLMPMESLPLLSRKGIGERGGQSYGFVLYRITCETIKNPVMKITGRVRDMATVIVDNVRQTAVFRDFFKQKLDFGFWGAVDEKKLLNINNGSHTIDILVENMGRNNFGFEFEDFDQRKGLLEGTVMMNDETLNGSWSIMALDFQPGWVSDLKGWISRQETSGELESPAMFKAYLTLDKIHDTFIDMRGWGKGVVFINGFNIGRYFSIGPQYTLYVPGPLLKLGTNTIIIFELFTQSDKIRFSSTPIVAL